MVLTRTEGKRPDFIYIRVAMRQAGLGNIGLSYFTDDKCMTTHINDVQHLAFEVDGALFYEWSVCRTSVKNRESAILHLVGIGTGNETTIVSLFYQVDGWNINRKSPVLMDTLKSVAVVLDSDGNRGRITGGYACPGIGREINPTVKYGAYQDGGVGPEHRLRFQLFLFHKYAPISVFIVNSR